MPFSFRTSAVQAELLLLLPLDEQLILQDLLQWLILC
jgi:hypothetical protein